MYKDPLFGNFFPWLASLYDPVIGGFYYSKSAKDSPEFNPDIESTAQALDILTNVKLMDSMPDEMVKKLILFFQQKQLDTGYFIDSHNDMKQYDRMVARALMYSLKSLYILGGKPLYPTESLVTKNLPLHLKSLDSLKTWLVERPWDNPWMACDNISATSVYFQLMEQQDKKEFLNCVMQFLEEKQDSQTGMWGEGRPYLKISGAFKLSLFFKKLNIPFPLADRVYDYMKYTLVNDTSEDMCWTRNVMDLLDAITPQLGEIPKKDIDLILNITWRNLRLYYKKDGGFSRHIHNSLVTPNNVPLGKGLEEGDMNASTQAIKIQYLTKKLFPAEAVKNIEILPSGFYKNILSI
ncbi:hypothetical protein [Spirochaeta cellobiosiphila]|uniref:hypothetical protein n=1 Tax=Spirochaeta cellobiosiphila TaxID=504483 RepID=UPI0004285410|nr:hypothetical protein [Spirochaeta cellobiosiphila]